MKLSDVTLNLDKINEGSWVDVPGDQDNLRFLLRGRRSGAYKKAYQKGLRSARRSFGRNQEKLVEHLTRVDAECIAQHCLLGWENLLDPKGQQIPYDAGMAKGLMTDPRYEPFQELVREMLDDLDNEYGDAADDTVEK